MLSTGWENNSILPSCNEQNQNELRKHFQRNLKGELFVPVSGILKLGSARGGDSWSGVSNIDCACSCKTSFFSIVWRILSLGSSNREFFNTWVQSAWLLRNGMWSELLHTTTDIEWLCTRNSLRQRSPDCCTNQQPTRSVWPAPCRKHQCLNE